GSCYKDQGIQGGMKRKRKECSDQSKADVSGRRQISVEEGVERRGASIEGRTGSCYKDQGIQGGMKRKRKKCSDQRKAVSCDKDQGIQRGMESKRKKCSDQGKEDQNTSQLADSHLPDEVMKFYGRSQKIEQIIQPIETRKAGIVVITGGPGFGKTTVAIKVGYKLRDRLENVVLFCSLRSKATVNDVATSMILTCSKDHFQPPENPQHWLRNWSKQQQQRIAFILDNADDVLESGDQAEFVTLLRDMKMFSKGNVTFVVTSRKLFKDPSVKEVRLTPLFPGEARKLIESKVDESEQAKLSQTEMLAKLCGYVPLALCIIGSLVSDYTEDELIRCLEEKPMDVLKEDLSDDNSVEKAIKTSVEKAIKTSVEKAIKTSFDYLTNSGQKALLLLSAFPGSFDSTAAKALISSSCPEQPELILFSLKNRSLVEKTAPQRYHVHQLIKAYAKKIGQAEYSQGEKEAFTHFTSRLVGNANMYWSKDKCKESIEAFNKDRHNFEYFLQFYLQGSNFQDPSHLKANLMTLVEEFSQKCLYLEMCLLPSIYVKLLETWLQLLMSVNNTQQPTSKIVELLCLLGHEKRKVGNHDEYKQYLERALKLHTENPNEFNRAKVSEAFFRNNYARFLSDEGNFDKAKEQFDIGLKVCEEYLSKDYVQKGVTLLYSGREDNRRNERNKAEKKLNEAFHLFQEGLGTHVMTALLLRSLADFHLFHGEKKLGSQENRQNATKLYGQALQMMVKLGIKDCKECILPFTNLGICHQLQGEPEEAMKLYQASLSIAERELAENHRWKIYVKVQMADCYKRTGNMVEAKKLKEQALQMSDVLGLSDNQPPNKFILKEI
ncbi:Regulatory protein AfsR, partial [Acropora cervicornis]